MTDAFSLLVPIPPSASFTSNNTQRIPTLDIAVVRRARARAFGTNMRDADSNRDAARYRALWFSNRIKWLEVSKRRWKALRAARREEKSNHAKQMILADAHTIEENNTFEPS